MAKKTKHERLQSLRNNRDYFFIGDTANNLYHRKSSQCLELYVKRKDMVGLGRDPASRGLRPCPLCRPELVELPPAPRETGKKKSRANITKEALMAAAEGYGLHLEFIGPNLYVTTIAGEWYFNYVDRPIMLHHKNNKLYLDRTGKPKRYYHNQDITFPSPLDAIQYIYRHERAAFKRGFGDGGSPDERVLLTLNEAVRAAERRAIAAALEATKGNRKRAAEILGVCERTLYRKRKLLGMTTTARTKGRADDVN